MRRRIILIAKIIIVILIIILVILAIYGIHKIGEIFKPSTTREVTNTSEEKSVYDQSEGEYDRYENYDILKEPISEDESKADSVSEETYPTYLLDYSELDIASVPEYSGEAYFILNDNVPEYTDEDKMNPIFEHYSYLDYLGRCGVATANLGLELMPTEERGSIGNIKPSGWHTVKYPELIEDRYLYNRCHLIAFSLAGENDNERNLITGTRYMNMSGMLPFENDVAKYIEKTGNHVLYRVTPCFEGDELVARGVHMEAWSVEDNGWGICFNVFVYNVQPGITIDYLTGDSWIE